MERQDRKYRLAQIALIGIVLTLASSFTLLGEIADAGVDQNQTQDTIEQVR